MGQPDATGRELGIWRATALVVGNMVGSGVFLLPSALAAYGGVSLLGWLFTTAGSLLLALTFSKLSRIVRQSGGPYIYTRVGFGDFAAFLVAWGYWISVCAGNAAIAVAFVGYLSLFTPTLGSLPWAGAVAAAAAIWCLTFVNSMGLRTAGSVQVATSILKLLPLLAIGFVGIFWSDWGHLIPFNRSTESLPSALNATATLTLWAFLGLESSTIPARHVKNPEQTIPRATVGGTLVASVIYIASSAAVMGLLDAQVLAESTSPFADAARTLWGSTAALLVGAGAAVACAGALNGWILVQGQLPLAAARDGLFPRVFARLSRRNVPVTGLFLSSLLATAILSLNYLASLVEQFKFVILLSTLTVLFPYVLCAMALVMILSRTNSPLKPGETRVWLSVSLLAFLYSLWAVAGSGFEAVYWGFLLLLCGIPAYVGMKWLRRKENDEE